MMESAASSFAVDNGHRKRAIVGLIILCWLIGIFLRLPPAITGQPPSSLSGLHPQPAFQALGFDEGLYRNYTNSLIKVGLSNYPAIVDRYIEVQKTLSGSILPPVRFLYIFAAYVWHLIFGTEALLALHDVASLFNILLLVGATVFSWRLKGPLFALGVAALMTFAPTQIHMSQHALVDGFFAFWALLVLWLLWENLQAPRSVGLVIGYAAALALLVLTKENSFFVWIAVLAILLTNRWFAFGGVTRELVLATFVGPLLGVAVLTFLTGGIPTLIETYRLSVSKNYQLPYAVLTGDGPWYRYLVDLLLVNPLVFLLALGAVFGLRRERKAEWFCVIFIAASYLVMCNLKYGMNLRYANMWDMPLCFLAFSELLVLAALFGRRQILVLALTTLAICTLEMRQYWILFVRYPLYELVTEGLLRALHILKSR